MEDRPLCASGKLFARCAALCFAALTWLPVPLLSAAEPDAVPEKVASPDKPAEAPAAEATPSDKPHAEARAAIDKFLKELVTIRQTRDGWSYGKLFDMRRIMREMGHQGVLDGAGFTRVLTLWLSLEGNLRFGSFFLMPNDEATLNAYHLGQINFSAEGSEAEAFVYFTGEDTEPWWARIWFIERNGRWRIFDHQRLDSGQRLTTSLAELGPGEQADKVSWRRAKDLVDQAWQSLQYGYGDENAIQISLQTARPLKKHPATELRRRLYEIYVAVENGSDEATTGKLIEDLQSIPNAAQQQPIIPLLVARYAAENDKHEMAIKAAKEFMATVGPDQEVCQICGNAELELEHPVEAAQAFRQGLTFDPTSVECLTGLARALPDSGAAEIGEHFSRLPDKSAWFETIAMELNARDRADALLAVVQAYRKVEQEDPNADYYEAMAWQTKGEPKRAAELLKAALPRVTDKDERGYFLESYYQAMIDAKLALEAYQGTENKQESFAKLAELLSRTDKLDQMRALIELHRGKFPRDPRLYFCLGVLEHQENHLDEADKAFAIGMRHAVDAEMLEELRTRRVDVAFEAKRALEAYKTIPPRRKTFTDLANRLRDSDQADLLEKLVKLHRQQDSRDPTLAMWEAEVLWLKKDYAAAAASLIAGRQRLIESEVPLWTYEDRLMRSLVRAERYEEAENVALGIKTRDEEEWFLLLVYATWQDEEAALEAAQRCIDAGNYSVDEMYDDEDIGPALRNKAFTKFRAKYPEPKE